MIEIDRSKWRRVRFGEVASNSKETVKDPLAAGLERVVALEHIEPGHLQLAGWQDAAGGTTFTRRFRAGQTLFAKRRAYQRKVAHAEFDGVCSGDILVFEAKPNELLPELLPFIVQSDAFFEHALRTSAGSLSPRTKWQDLAKWECDLPPLDEQKPIADLLWAANRAANAQLACAEAAVVLEGAYFAGHGKGGSAPEVPLGELLEVCQYGLSARAGSQGAYPMLRMTNVVDGQVSPDDLKYVDLSDDEADRFLVRAGDVLFNRTNSPEFVGRTGLYALDGSHVFASYLVRLRTVPELDPAYLNAFINSSAGQKRVRVHLSKGVCQANISASNLKKVLVPVLPVEEQRRIVANIGSVGAMRQAANEAFEATESVARRLAETIMFGGKR